MNPQNDHILEGLRPRMHAARVAHVRRMIAGLAMVPLVGFGAVAMAADTADAPSIETAGVIEDGPNDHEPNIGLPDIGDAGGDVAETPTTTEPDGGEGAASAEEPKPTQPPEEQTKVLSMGPIGEAEVAEVDGEIELLHTNLAAGWEIIKIDVTDDGIVIGVKNGDVIKLIAITPGVRNEIDVRVTDFVIPTTTTTTTAPPPPVTEKPHEKEPPITDRFVVEVSGKGSFVVEREGETLWVGNVEVNEGYDYSIEKGEGWKVYVKFTNGEWNWFGKAAINDFGEIDLYFWDEEAVAVFEPIYQWVEVPGVGAVQFKLWSDGLVYVKQWEAGEGFGFYDYNGGAPAEVAKIDFEGEGVIWIIEAWKNADGGLSWSTTDVSPTA